MRGPDAESKVSKSGKPYLRLNVRAGDGDAAQWVSVMAFDPEAVSLASKFIKGTRTYIEGSIKLDEWTAQDGTKRHGLSVMSWHCKLAAIGRNRPKRESDDSKQRAAATPAPSSTDDDRQRRVRGTADSSLNDEIPI
jgi:single-stranded DNA-binding protein